MQIKQERKDDVEYDSSVAANARSNSSHAKHNHISHPPPNNLIHSYVHHASMNQMKQNEYELRPIQVAWKDFDTIRTYDDTLTTIDDIALRCLSLFLDRANAESNHRRQRSPTLMSKANKTSSIHWIDLEERVNGLKPTEWDAIVIKHCDIGFDIAYALFDIQKRCCLSNLRLWHIVQHSTLMINFLQMIRSYDNKRDTRRIRCWFNTVTSLGPTITDAPLLYCLSSEAMNRESLRTETETTTKTETEIKMTKVSIDSLYNGTDCIGVAMRTQTHGLLNNRDRVLQMVLEWCPLAPHHCLSLYTIAFVNPNNNHEEVMTKLCAKQHSRVMLAHYIRLHMNDTLHNDLRIDMAQTYAWLVEFTRDGCSCIS